jgi:tetratricopeptide (TPR) repeat protein
MSDADLSQPTMPSEPDKPVEGGVTLAERLQDEQRARWRRGERVLVEAYLSDHPELAGDVEAVLDLIYNEVLLRKQQQEHPQLEEYLRRFPNLSEPVRDLFEVDRALDSDPQQAAESIQFFPHGEANSGSDGQASTISVSIPGYEILRELGRGGMGVVYYAWQNNLRRVVAIKTVLAGSAAAPEQLGRFQCEAEAVARLQHPNIVQIHEVSRDGSTPYLVLEYVDGGSLAQKLDGTPQPPQQAAQLVEVLARAVHHAHQKGIIHRDLKPANVLLLKDGTPRISDFGLAKFIIGGGGGKTQTGEILGTPSYMAPEQGMGRVRDVGPWTDVYALGAILYELLTGRPPFKGATPFETIIQAASDEPVPPTRLQPKVPRDLETICLKCLQKDQRRRYLSALDLADDLGRFSRHEPIRARPAGLLYRLAKLTRRHTAVVLSLAVVFLALVLGIVGTTAGLVRARTERDRAEAAEREARRLLSASRRDAAHIALQRGDWRAALAYIDLALADDPLDSPALHLDRARALCALHDIPQAAAELERLTQRTDLADLEGQVLLWKASLALNHSSAEMKPALAMVRQALERDLPPAEAAYAHALLARSSPEALEHLRQAVQADPFHPQAQGMLALLLSVTGRHEEARESLLVAELLFTEDPLFPVIHALLLTLQDNVPAAREQLEKARPHLSARQWASAQAVLELGSQVPALGHMLEGAITGDANFSLHRALLGVLLSGSRTRAALKHADLYLPLPPVLMRAFQELPGPLNLIGMGGDNVAARLERIAELHPDALFYLMEAVLLGNQDRPEKWAASEKAFLRAAETPSILPLRRVALYGAAGAEWVLCREGPRQTRDETRRRAVQNMRKLMAAGIQPAQAPLLLAIAFEAHDTAAAQWILHEWERQTPTDSRLPAQRIRVAFHSEQYARAIDLIDEAVRKNPREAATWKKVRDAAVERLRQQAADTHQGKAKGSDGGGS